MDKVRRLTFFAYVSFLAAWAIGFIAWLIKLACYHQLFPYVSGNNFYFIDFATYLMCAKLAVSSARGHLYDPAVQLAYYNQVIAPLHVAISPYVQYVPWFFLFMVPFAVLSIAPAYVIWNFVSVAFGLASITCLLIYLRKQNWRQCSFFCLWLMAFYPAQEAIYAGQTSWLCLGLLAWFSRFYLQSRDIACGIMLALMTLKPQYLPFLLVPIIARRRWPVLIYFVAGVIGLSLISAFYFGPASVFGYPPVLLNMESARVDVFPAWMVSLRGPLSLLFDHKLALQVSLFACLVALAALYFIWRQAKGKDVCATLSLTVVAMLIFSPHTHSYDLTMLALPAALTVPQLTRWQWGQRKDYKLFDLLFLALPIIGFVLFGVTEAASRMGIRSLIFFAIDVVLLVLFWRNWQKAIAHD